MKLGRQSAGGRRQLVVHRRHLNGTWSTAVLPVMNTAPPPPSRRNAGLLHVCTSGRQYKAQKENWPVSGVKDHRYLSVRRMRHENARRQPSERTKAAAVQRGVATTAM